MNREPLATASGITAVVAAVIGLLVAFGIDLTEDQKAAILTAVGVLGPIAVALIARGRVTPLAAPQDDAGNALTPAGQ